MDKIIGFSLLLAALILSGCVMRVVPKEVDRVDQEVRGNRGIVRGRLSEFPAAEKKKTKTVYDVEIELFSPVELKETEEIEKKKGNKGYIQRRDVPERKSGMTEKSKGGAKTQRLTMPQQPQVIYQQPIGTQDKYKKETGAGTLSKKEEAQNVYIVEKGDTLQKISEKIYGTTKRWKKIYEANTDVLKSPDRIKPGQNLVIPKE